MSSSTDCVICNNEVNKSEKEWDVESLESPSAQSSQSGCILQSHLTVYFVLKHIFELKESQLKVYLQKCGGGDPGQCVKLCQKCEQGVKDIMGIFSTLNEIQRKFEKAKWTMQETILFSKKGKAGTRRKMGVDGISFVYHHRFCNRRNKGKSSPRTQNPFKDGDQRATELALRIDGDKENLAKQEVIDIAPHGQEEDHDVNDCDGSFDNFPDELSSDDSSSVKNDDYKSVSGGCDALTRTTSSASQLGEDGKRNGILETPSMSGRSRRHLKMAKYTEMQNDNDEDSDEAMSEVNGSSKSHVHVASFYGNPSKEGICKTDGKTFDTVPTLKKNRSRGHSKKSSTPSSNLDFKTTCTWEGCGKVLKSHKLLNVHIRKVHERKYERICTICGVKCCTKTYLKTHMATFHDTDNSKNSNSGSVNDGNFSFTCESCGKHFKSNYDLEYHVRRTHQRTWEKICKICDRRLVNSYVLKCHMASVHGIGKNDAVCDICGKSFGNQKYLKQHIKYTHEKDLPSQCDICHKAFRCKQFLNGHKASVHGIGIKCDVERCSKVCPNESQLEEHKKYMHEGVAANLSFSCQFCGKAFPVQAKVKRHEEAVHTNRGTKPFKCSMPSCEKTFAAEQYLKYHLKLVHKINKQKFAE